MNSRRGAAVLIGAALMIGLAVAREGGLLRVPVERLEDNLAARQREHPEDPEGYYLLGRLEAFAFAADTTVVAEFPYWASPSGVGDTHFFTRLRLNKNDVPYVGEKKESLDFSKFMPNATQALGHLTSGLKNLRKSIELGPSEAKRHLTLAFLLERARHLAGQLDFDGLGFEASTKVDPKLEAVIAKAIHDLSTPTASLNEARSTLETRLDEAVAVIARFRAGRTSRRNCS